MMPLKKPLLDSSWLLFLRFSWISSISMNFDVFLRIWRLAGLAGVWLAGLLMAGCWLLAGRMMRRRGSKVVPHARRSGEVGGFSFRLINGVFG